MSSCHHASLSPFYVVFDHDNHIFSEKSRINAEAYLVLLDFLRYFLFKGIDIWSSHFLIMVWNAKSIIQYVLRTFRAL